MADRNKKRKIRKDQLKIGEMLSHAKQKKKKKKKKNKQQDTKMSSYDEERLRGKER